MRCGRQVKRVIAGALLVSFTLEQEYFAWLGNSAFRTPLKAAPKCEVILHPNTNHVRTRCIIIEEGL